MQQTYETRKGLVFRGFQLVSNILTFAKLANDRFWLGCQLARLLTEIGQTKPFLENRWRERQAANEDCIAVAYE